MLSEVLLEDGEYRVSDLRTRVNTISTEARCFVVLLNDDMMDALVGKKDAVSPLNDCSWKRTNNSVVFGSLSGVTDNRFHTLYRLRRGRVPRQSPILQRCSLQPFNDTEG